MRLITFFILILLHTVSKIGMYNLLYILTRSLYFKKQRHCVNCSFGIDVFARGVMPIEKM